MYAIVDIETTGGAATKSRMTEIAIYVHDGTQVIDSYQSLLNPEQEIPAYITDITGIDQQMVAHAPLFKDLAPELFTLLQDKVFIAHNVGFDYAFVKREFEAAGYPYHPEKLCTVRLSRRVFPGMNSYSLGTLCKNLEIPIQNRHRAAGDAKATAVLFGLLLQKDPIAIKKALRQKDKKTLLAQQLTISF